MMRSLSIHISFILAMFPLIGLAQNNVGIGTKTPHLTAITHIDDSSRGLLIPRTDTQSVWNYVNTLSPNPGIAHGLTIFDVNLRSFYIYNGIKMKWEPISSVSGPAGPTGVTGVLGQRGPLNEIGHWRDSADALPTRRRSVTTTYPKYTPYYNKSLGDSCNDLFHETSTGLIFAFDCTTLSWMGPIARWRTFGVPKTEALQSKALITDQMAAPGDTALKFLTGLKTVIKVPPDTIAYVTITSEGNVRKTNVNDTAFNTVKFDFFMIDPTTAGTYLNRGQIIRVRPNNKPIPPSVVSLYDKAPWSITTNHTFEGKISPAGSPLPANDFLEWSIETHYRHLFTPGNPTGANGQVTIVDNKTPGIYESFAVMNVYVVFERSPNAPDPQ